MMSRQRTLGIFGDCGREFGACFPCSWGNRLEETSIISPAWARGPLAAETEAMQVGVGLLTATFPGEPLGQTLTSGQSLPMHDSSQPRRSPHITDDDLRGSAGSTLTPPHRGVASLRRCDRSHHWPQPFPPPQPLFPPQSGWCGPQITWSVSLDISPHPKAIQEPSRSLLIRTKDVRTTQEIPRDLGVLLVLMRKFLGALSREPGKDQIYFISQCPRHASHL